MPYPSDCVDPDAVVGPTVQLELDAQAMYRTHDTPTPPEWATSAGAGTSRHGYGSLNLWLRRGERVTMGT